MSKAKYRYYCLYRPPMPGTVPRGMINLEFMDDRPHVPEINHTAWGFVEYDHPLSDMELQDYELSEPIQIGPEGCNDDSCSL